VFGDGAVPVIQLVLKDGTTAELGNGSLSTTPVHTFTLCGNFLGFNCNFRRKSTGAQNVEDLAACEVYEDFPVVEYSVIPNFVDFTTYYLYDNSFVMPWDSTEVGCYGEIYSATYTKDGVASPKPVGLTEGLSPSIQKLTLYTTNEADLGVWTVTIAGSINIPLSDSFTRTFTILHDCLRTTITNRIIDPMSYIIGNTAA